MNYITILPVYAGSGTNYFDLSLEPTQELFVTLVTFYRVCSVTSVALHKSLFCHFGDVTHCEVNYRASYRSVPTG